MYTDKLDINIVYYVHVSMKIGAIVAESIYSDINDMKKTFRRVPTLAIVQVGNDPASNVYIKYKKRACDKLQFDFNLFHYDSSISTEELVGNINSINNDSSVTGCIVQLPLPDHIDKFRILNAVCDEKDVDCFNINNISKLYFGAKSAKYIPATVLGIYKFIQYNNIDTKGKLCVIMGKSNIVGKPLQLLLSDEFDMALTTVLCDKYTENVKDLTSKADILIVATGVHHLVNTSDWIKDGATVIDVGIHKIGKKVEGDVNYNELEDKAGIITPVPGGVGPLTVASLMYNLALSAQDNDK